MKAHVWSWLVVSVCVWTAASARAQPRVGALAIDARQGDQFGWAVDYETPPAAQAAALRECGAGCSVVLTFGRCGAYAADQDADSTAVGWSESYASAADARQAALAECGSRSDGSGCVVRVWGCNGQVIEEGLNLDRASRRQIQQGLQAGGFDPGGADGLFGPRTRAAIREWQSARGARATGYLDGVGVETLRSAGAPGPAVAAVTPSAPPAATATRSPALTSAEQAAAAAELEGLFWQSVLNSTNPSEFEAYLRRFPSGLFSELAQARLAALRASANDRPATAGTRVGESVSLAVGSRVSRGRVSGTSVPGSRVGAAAAGEARRRPGEVFRDCADCPEMVVLPGGGLALGRYQVTVGEYRAFASASGSGRFPSPRPASAERSGAWRMPPASGTLPAATA